MNFAYIFLFFFESFSRGPSNFFRAILAVQINLPTQWVGTHNHGLLECAFRVLMPQHVNKLLGLEQTDHETVFCFRVLACFFCLLAPRHPCLSWTPGHLQHNVEVRHLWLPKTAVHIKSNSEHDANDRYHSS